MPHQARLDIPGMPYHIMVRGINNSTIFENDPDRVQLARCASTLQNEDWMNWGFRRPRLQAMVA